MKNKKDKQKNKKFKFHFEINSETRKGIEAVLLIAFALICFLSLIEATGNFGKFLDHFLQLFFGWGRWTLPFILIIFSYLLLSAKYVFNRTNYLGLFLFILSLVGLLQFFTPLPVNFQTGFSQINNGGYLGFLINYPLNKLMGIWGTQIILSASLIIGLLLMFNTSLLAWYNFFIKLYEKIKNIKFKQKQKDQDKKNQYLKAETKDFLPLQNTSMAIGVEPQEKEQVNLFQELSPLIKKTKPIHQINLPIDLLEKNYQKPTSGNTQNNQIIIQRTLANFGIPVEMKEIKVGPTITQYSLKPSDGIKLSKITALHNDLSLTLAAHPIRIEAPIPGESLVGIEVPNKSTAIVGLREILEAEEFKTSDSRLTFALGKDVAGKVWTADLIKMPHLLIAGATGAGKTVGLNSFIVSLLYKNQSDQLKFIFIDPKKVELIMYEGIPHLLTPVIIDIQKAINALKWAVSEMDRRFYLLSGARQQNIKEYNQQAENKLPYIIIVIDEMADLMMQAASDAEALIIRLAQMARAVGIHLILATQRPSVNIITGLIKANITTRIAFNVASSIDSRTILDASGAEKLLGRGDMLYLSPEFSKPKRIQCAFVSNSEIKKVVDFIKETQEPDSIEETIETSKVSNVENFSMDSDINNSDDELFAQAKEVILKYKKASASLLQRRLRIGYARAARLLDLLEDQGIIGPVDGAKPREIYIDSKEEVINNF
ncbi:cell division protein FtsK [Candidatus Kuenenbacteria bacterium HGW-Kuenenbacteria-1]|uniref:Cell division protein FtsK n=1 Tax=Candidatus Kuenenbacteria bacterium HGW-Kuenenbacteria-1 TaxID=2013812 RepID=A0A2N1UN23_9BACT|nr:MAG: cell division protein FtsK [Candidatus Kuenenbacteria bacterium HGW-Kuenenbacteria-1]